MKFKFFFLLALVLLLLSGCELNSDEKERLSILQEKSYVAFVENEDVKLLSPNVWLESHQKALNEPFLITFKITGELKSVVDDNYTEIIDSRNLVNDKKGFVKSGSFYIGNTITLNKAVSQDDLEKMIENGEINVSITEIDGDVITSSALKRFVIGLPDGSIVNP